MTRQCLHLRAFTLLELVLVMVVICAAMAIVAPSFRGFSRSSSANDVVTQLVAVIQWARSQAIAEGRTYRLNIDSRTGAYWLTAQDQEQFTQLGTEFGQTFNLPEGTSISLIRQSDAPGDGIDFYPSGRAVMANIHLQDSHGTQTIIGSLSPTESFQVLPQSEAIRR